MMSFSLFKKLGLILIILSLALPILGLAQESEAEKIETLPLVPVGRTLMRVAALIFYVLLGLAIIFLVYAGIVFTTAEGSPEKIETAKRMILYALIGIVVAVIARGAVALLRDYLVKK